jgi:biopolymer transport protein TolR
MAITTRDGRTQTALAEINMIPFIDVVLVLLIIFMITAPVIQSGLEVNVPKTEVVNELSKNLPVITIDAKEKLFLQDAPVNIRELSSQIKENFKDGGSVYLQADGEVAWSTSTAVIEALTTAGIKNIVIVTQPIEKKR